MLRALFYKMCSISFQVVREQCWLNEILLGCQWTTEGITNSEDLPADETDATEDELQAVLTGEWCRQDVKQHV